MSAGRSATGRLERGKLRRGARSGAAPALRMTRMLRRPALLRTAVARLIDSARRVHRNHGGGGGFHQGALARRLMCWMGAGRRRWLSRRATDHAGARAQRRPARPSMSAETHMGLPQQVGSALLVGDAPTGASLGSFSISPLKAAGVTATTPRCSLWSDPGPALLVGRSLRVAQHGGWLDQPVLDVPVNYAIVEGFAASERADKVREASTGQKF